MQKIILPDHFLDMIFNSPSFTFSHQIDCGGDIQVEADLAGKSVTDGDNSLPFVRSPSAIPDLNIL